MVHHFEVSVGLTGNATASVEQQRELHILCGISREGRARAREVVAADGVALLCVKVSLLKLEAIVIWDAILSINSTNKVNIVR